MITWFMFSLQDACNPLIEELMFFHDFTIIILIFIISTVACFIEIRALNLFYDKNLLQGHIVECLWTTLPILILIQVAVPSLLILYVIDDRMYCRLSLKVTGHQWYWTYEYRDFWASTLQNPITLDSYMVPEARAGLEEFRTLDVDNRAVLPYTTTVRLLVRSQDVLHSWALPALGVKVDASPGRLNQIKLYSHRPGVYFGQCSEICGANHSFIPICVEFISPLDFLNWAQRAEF